MIEDAPAGIAAGLAAGATVWAVTTTHAASELSAAHAVCAALPEILGRLRAARANCGWVGRRGAAARRRASARLVSETLAMRGNSTPTRRAADPASLNAAVREPRG